MCLFVPQLFYYAFVDVVACCFVSFACRVASLCFRCSQYVLACLCAGCYDLFATCVHCMSLLVGRMSFVLAFGFEVSC